MPVSDQAVDGLRRALPNLTIRRASSTGRVAIPAMNSQAGADSADETGHGLAGCSAHVLRHIWISRPGRRGVQSLVVRDGVFDCGGLMQTRMRAKARYREDMERRLALPLLPYTRAIGIIILIILAPPAFGQGSQRADVEARVDAILGRLTLEEKLGQLHQLGGDPKSGRSLDGQRELIRRGRIGSLLNVRGAPNANEVQRIALEESPSKIPILLGFDVLHGYRTVFPIALGQASSWDPAAVERTARIAAAEASAAEVRWVFAPMVDIARDPRWGRIAEGSGEDPYLGSVMAHAHVRGFQGPDYGAPDRVAACAKHWVA